MRYEASLPDLCCLNILSAISFIFSPWNLHKFKKRTIKIKPFKDEAQTALFKTLFRTAQ